MAPTSKTATAASCRSGIPAAFPFVARVFADGGYASRLVTWAADRTHILLEIIRRGARAKGLEVLPRRWVVERTFAWIFNNRRLVRDYEQFTAIANSHSHCSFRHPAAAMGMIRLPSQTRSSL